MNINCPGCNFEYKLDERRIPASGQKMRCPKCSASFKVTKEGIIADTASAESVRKASPSMPPVLGNSKFSPDKSGEIDDPFGDTSPTPGPNRDSWGDTFDERPGTSSPGDPFGDPFASVRKEKGNPAASELPRPLSSTDLPRIAMPSELPRPISFSDLPSPADQIDIPDSSGAGISEPDAASPFGDIGIPDGNDPFGEPGNISIAPATDHSSATEPERTANRRSQRGSTSSESPFNEDVDIHMDDPFGAMPISPSVPSSRQSIAEQANDAPSFSPSAIPSIQPDDFDIPSPADLTSIPPDPIASARHSVSVSTGSSLDDFGNIDLQGDITDSIPPGARLSANPTAGTTNFGQVDLGFGQQDESGEFDAFPVQEENDNKPAAAPVSDDLDLVDAPIRSPLDEDSFGGLPQSTVAGGGAGEKAEQKTAGAFEGRRRYERQSRKTRIILMLVLLLIAVAGGSLHFTPYGVFGVNALVSLMPDATADEQVKRIFENTVNALDKDTFYDVNRSITELTQARAELDQNEDLRIIGVYVHSWHQLRFGISDTQNAHEKAAVSLLGNIKLTESESPYASIANYARQILSDKNDMVIKALSSKTNLSSNEAALLVMAHLKQNDPQGALDAVRKGIRKRVTPRFEYLKSVALWRLKKTAECRQTLTSLIKSAPNHFDARLLLAELMVREKEKDSQKVTELLTPIHESDENHSSSAQKASVHALMGKMLLQRRKFDEAKNEFTKARSLNPKDTLMLNGIGTLALMSGDLPGAVTSFRAALREEPDNTEATLGAAATLIQQGNDEEARALISPILQNDAKNPVAHYLSGVLAQGIEQYEQALSEYKKAIELDSEYIEAYVAMATVYMALKQNREAMKTLDDAAKAVPGSALIKLTLADSHAENQDYASAVVNLNEALEIEPDNPIIHFKMAQMYRKMEELEDAQNALDEVSRIDPAYPGLSVEQGYLMELSGKISDALRSYEAALKKNPDDLSAKTRVAAASIYQGNLDRAKELLVDVLNENADSPDGNFYMGEIFRLERSGPDAVPYLKRATELDPGNPLYFVRYGAVLFMIHDMGKAVQQFEKAMALDPNMAETYIRIGELKLRSGAIKAAIEQFTRALELNPGIEDANIFIGQAYEEMADLKSASAYYQKETKQFPKNPEGYYRLGKVFLQTKGNQAGIAPLRTAIRLAESQNPAPYWLPDALYYLGISQKSTDDRSGAIASFRKYLEIAPEDAIDRAEVKASLDSLLN